MLIILFFFSLQRQRVDTRARNNNFNTMCPHVGIIIIIIMHNIIYYYV